MITSPQLGAGYALVPHTSALPDVIRVPGSNVVQAHAGNTVYRTPHLVVREAEAGSGWPTDLSNMMFTPNGDLVPATAAAYDMLQGAAMEPVIVHQPSMGLRGLVPAISMFVGAGIGYHASPERKVWGTIGGAVVGGILGLLFR
jgi:hypothetical protein